VSTDAQTLVEVLELSGRGDTWTWEPVDGERRVFGGLLVAQALRAAQRTVDAGRHPHAVHAAFVGAADGRQPVRYDVERTRDGASFTARRVVARQDGQAVFTLSASFQEDEAGPVHEPPPPLDVPAPEQCPVGRYAGPHFDSRDVPVAAVGAPGHRRFAWFRPRGPLPPDPAVHAAALAYVSDHGPTRAVRQPHADHPALEQRMSVSLDHSLWFHRPPRVEGWMLSELWPVATGAGRGLAMGSIRSADGDLLASVAQEALLRLPG
jgi:acyl-CoA thioesterase II